jgi:hypothetical protein
MSTPPPSPSLEKGIFCTLADEKIVSRSRFFVEKDPIDTRWGAKKARVGETGAKQFFVLRQNGGKQSYQHFEKVLNFSIFQKITCFHLYLSVTVLLQHVF